jgi:Arc/MetJ family transcription regulator
MRTTIVIPEELIEEARLLLGYKSKTDTVIFSLRELVRQQRIAELKGLAGNIHLDLDLPAARRRPPAPRADRIHNVRSGPRPGGKKKGRS